MNTGGKGDPPPYIIRVGGDEGVRVYQLRTPSTPPSTTVKGFPGGDTAYKFYEVTDNEVIKVTSNEVSEATAAREQTVNAGQVVATSEGMKHFVSEDHQLGHSPGITTCPSCQQHVLTEVQYKIGRYAWLVCLAFILCGMVTCGLLWFFMPLSFLKRFKDAYHSCPRCHRILHVDKKKCCPRE